MKKMPLVFVVFLVLLASFVTAQPVSTSIDLVGLNDRVTVRRDGRSIPYIEAKNDADLYFAQGYVTASDRLWQMDLLRRVARGETAEIFGKTTLEEDKRWRRFGFASVVEQSLKLYTPEMRAVLESYANGVNAYIATLNDASLPVEFKILQYKPRPWTPADSLMIGKILADGLSTSYPGDLTRESLIGFDPQKLADLNNKVTPYDVVLFGKDAAAERRGTVSKQDGQDEQDKAIRNSNLANPVYSVNPVRNSTRGFDHLAIEEDAEIRERSLRRIGFYAEELAASNNWVISGKRTADGKALLANDPHLDATAPGIWYMAHLTTPTMRVSGVTFPGSPGIVLGHNENIAWGATNVGPDVQDLYVETIEGTKYKTPDGWSDLAVRQEKIGVRQNPLKTDLTIETLEVQTTRHGPIILERNGKKYALKWTASDPNNFEIETFYHLNRSRNWEDFKNALKRHGGAMQNFIYADTNGNIGWYAGGKVPKRKTGDGSLPYDGSTNDGEWTGFIPFAELPNLYNPPEGFLVTANQRIVGTSYPHQELVRDYAMPWRARRLYDILSKNTKVTMDAVTDAQLDDLNMPLSMLAKDLVKLNALSPENLEIVKSWDGKMKPESRAALLVNEIRNCTANKIAEANKPVPAGAIREKVLWWAVSEQSARWLPKEFKNYSEMLRSCNDASSAAFTTRYGADQTKWVWGSASKARFPHPLAAAPIIGGQFATPNIPIAGSGQTPNVASYVSMRHIASPGNWDATRHVIPLGQSGDPKSPFYKDQFEAWRTGTAAVFPFSASAVESAAKSIVLFNPK